MARLRHVWIPILLAALHLPYGRSASHQNMQVTVRLVGGSEAANGRLEVFHAGEWGTVCDDGFDRHPSASVVCRQLGYVSGGAVWASVVTPGTGRIWLDDVECTGEETRIENCPHQPWGDGNCGHNEDVGIQCYGHNINNLDVRLADVRNVHSGRLEVRMQGTWGTVCGLGWASNEITVACKMLGYTTGSALFGDDVQDGAGQPLINRVACAGTETGFNSCPVWEPTVNQQSSCNPQTDDLGLRCSGASVSALVLETWKDSSTGIDFQLAVVQISSLSSPLTLCVSDFTDDVAAVICRQIGYSGGSADRRFSSQVPGHLASFRCSGTEASLEACEPNWVGAAGTVTTCAAFQVAAVSCSGGGNASLSLSNTVDGSLRLVGGSSASSGRLEVYYNRQWGTVCDDRFDIADARVACRQMGKNGLAAILPTSEYTRGSHSQPIWMDEMTCGGEEALLVACNFPGWGAQDCGHTEDVGISCTGDQYTITDARLADGARFQEGRLEVKRSTTSGSQWGSVCDLSFTSTDAQVVCRELGMHEGMVTPDHNRGSGPILLRDVTCTGSESSLAQCNSIPGPAGCQISNSVGVSCNVEAKTVAGSAASDSGGGGSSVGVVIGAVLPPLICLCCCLYMFKQVFGARRRRAAAVVPLVSPSLSQSSSSLSLKVTGKVEVVDEEKPCSNSVSRDKIPSYWTSNNEKATDAFDQMVYVNTDAFKAFDEILAHTYRPITTQDRPCPKKVQCAKKPGGCECVKPGGDPGLPTGFVVRRVIRVEEADMWARYVQKRESLKEKRRGGVDKFDPPIFTDEVANQHHDVFLGLDASVNETYLWHGTHVRAALAIAQNDFRIDLAGTGAGTMYGKGAYMAESSTKADEYAKDEPNGYYDGVFALVLCRVTLGKYFYTTDRDPSAQAKVQSGEFDSTCGDRVKSVHTYRELVVYNNDQIYPEFVVLYNRVFKTDNMHKMRQDAQKHLLHMQLPVYWNNCHLDPSKEGFKRHYNVKKQTVNLIQTLVNGACTKNPPNVRRVRRVEDSEMWTNYVKFRADVVARPGYVKPVQELDGDPHSGHVITQALLDSDELEEQAISIENLDARANELLLWHGTSQEAAEAIAESGFRIAHTGATHGKRFGEGAYFAEDLTKSLSYTSDSAGGLLYVLLCRVVCGDIFYTEQGSDTLAHVHARNDNKDSIVANPKKAGPREFIVLREAQVYPEFILELKE